MYKDGNDTVQYDLHCICIERRTGCDEGLRDHDINAR